MCYDDDARPPLPPGPTGAATGSDLVLAAADGNQFAAFRALPEAAPHAQIVILPDIRGLHQFYKDLALRFAESGVAAVAIDYFGRTAGLTARDDSFEWMPHVQQMSVPTFLADTQAALEHLRSQVSSSLPTFTLGFCLGGMLSFFCGMEELGLSGVVGFYAGMTRDMGKGTLLDRAGEINVPALGLFGGDDAGIPAEKVAAFDEALDGTGVPHEIIVYPGAPHSFFDRRAEQFAAESADAWTRVLRFVQSPSTVTA